MKLSWPYIAGFFDGEGCISLCSNRARPNTTQYSVTFSQAGPEGLTLLTEIREFLSVQGIKSYLRSRAPGAKGCFAKKTVYNLAIMSRPSVKPCLEALLPYLRIKKVKCEDILRWLKLFPPRPAYHLCIYNAARRQKYPAGPMRADRATGMAICEIAKRHGVSYHIARRRVEDIKNPLRRVRPRNERGMFVAEVG